MLGKVPPLTCEQLPPSSPPHAAHPLSSSVQTSSCGGDGTTRGVTSWMTCVVPWRCHRCRSCRWGWEYTWCWPLSSGSSRTAPGHELYQLQHYNGNVHTKHVFGENVMLYTTTYFTEDLWNDNIGVQQKIFADANDGIIEFTEMSIQLRIAKPFCIHLV